MTLCGPDTYQKGVVFGSESGCRHPKSLLGCRTCADRPPPARARRPRSAELVTISRRRQAQALLVCLAALCADASAYAEPGSVASKQAQAQQVLAQIQQIDRNLDGAVEAANLAN